MSFSWTGRQLDSITKSDGAVVSFTYDANGMRTEKTVGDETYGYVWQNGKLIAETYVNGTNSRSVYYIYDENGSPVAWSYLDEYYYYIKNQQGDILGFTDSEGNVVVTYEYDAWGNLIFYTGTSYLAEYNGLRYRGYAYDNETGLYYLQSRYYDPQVGRFLNADDTDYLGASGTVLGYNLYAYCENNPINLSDAFGNIAGVDDATIVLFIALCVLTVGLFHMVSSSGFQQAWTSFCVAVGNGLSSIGSAIDKGGQAAWNWTKKTIKAAISALVAFQTIAKAASKVISRVSAARKNVYRFFEIYFVNDVPILGAPLTRDAAVTRLRRGNSVITYYSTDALYAANKSGRSKASCDQKHGGVGFFNHYHLSGRPTHAHSFYIIRG